MRIRSNLITVLFVTVFFAVGVPAFVLFTNVGKSTLISAITSYLKMQNIELSIKGSGENFEKIEKIIIKTKHGTGLIISDFVCSKKKITDKISINIKKLTLNMRAFKSESDEDVVAKIKKIITIAKILKIFISEICLKEGYLYLGNTHAYSFDNVYCDFEKELTVLTSQIDKNGAFRFEFCNHGLSESKISFENINDFSGFVVIEKFGDRISNYRLDVKNGDMKVVADGIYNYSASLISSDNIEIWYKNNIYKAKGSIALDNKEIHLKSKIKLSAFANDLPTVCNAFQNEIKFNFASVLCLVEANYQFGENKPCIATISFKKEGQIFENDDDKGSVIGDLKCTMQNDAIDILGDIDGINIYGFHFKNLECKITKLKQLYDINLRMNGDGFHITTNAKNDGKLTVENFEFNVDKNGTLKSTKAFLLSRNAECNFKFSFNDIGFLSSAIPVRGDATGNITYKNSDIFAKCFSKKLILHKKEFANTSITLNKNDIFVISKYGKNSSINIKGKISKKNICLSNSFISSPKSNLNLKICDLDFDGQIYKIYCESNDKKYGKRGVLSIVGDRNELNIKLDSINTNTAIDILDYGVPNFLLNGSILLKMQNNITTGKGNITISNFSGNVINVDLNLLEKQVELNAKLKSANECIRADLRLPIYIRNASIISNNDHEKTINCHIYGNAKLENIIKLTDKYDMRGALDCNLMIVGSLSNPTIEGVLNLNNAYFVIDNILLSNGTISFSCKGNRISVLNAEFIDYKKKKLSVTGYGTFFIDNMIPNINTNLNLHANNFRLFDSDDMKITANGNGKINGNIDNLTISGNVDIPECKLLKLEANLSEKDNDLIIENEINIKNKEEEDRIESFCKYDINMNCPKVDVIGDSFDMSLAGKLKLSTYKNVSTLIGLLNLTYGKVDLFGKRMQMTRGKVEFFEKYPFDPLVKLTCKKNIGSMIAYLEITNIPEKGGSIDLRSEPNHSKDIILSYILFEKDEKYLSFAEAAQLTNAILSFNKKGYIFSILNMFKSTGIVDNISFSDAEKTSGILHTNKKASSQNINVGAGKYVRDNVYVSVNKDYEKNTSIDVDLAITPEVSAKINTNGDTGVGWKYRY